MTASPVCKLFLHRVLSAMILLLAGFPYASFAQTEPAPSGGKDVIVVLRATNKITARSEIIKGPVDTVLVYGPLEIRSHRCSSKSTRSGQNYSSLLEIYERIKGGSPDRLFSGWMFSDSPSLTSLEHRIYDITLVSCEAKVEEAEKKKEQKTETAPPPVETPPAPPVQDFEVQQEFQD